MRNRSLTFRVTAAVVALVATVCVLLTLLTASALARFLDDRLAEDLAASHGRAARALERGLLPAPPPGVQPPDIQEAPGQEVGTVTAYFTGSAGEGQVIDADGRLTALDEDDLAALRDTAQDGADGETVDLPGLGEHRVAATEGDSVTLVTALPTAPVDAAVASVVRWAALFGTVGTVAAGLVAAFVVRRQLRPLREVAVTAHRVTETDLSTGEIGQTERVPEHLVSAGSEVGQVAGALNALLGHVERALDARHHSEQQVRRFVADASHELRTPLATVRGYADLGLRDDTDTDGRTRALAKVRTEAERMGALVDDLLLLARLDQGRPLAREEVDLTMLVMESVADARVTAPDHRWRLALPDEPVTITGDAARLHQVLTNLLTNASRHTPEGTTVTSSISAGAGEVLVAVTDDGPGIDPDLGDEVFTRFARGDTARTRAASGAGLGLSLARSIARAHGGDVTVESRPGHTCFSLHLPAPTGSG